MPHLVSHGAPALNPIAVKLSRTLDTCRTQSSRTTWVAPSSREAAARAHIDVARMQGERDMPLDPNPSRAQRRLAYRVPERLEASDLAARLKLALAGNDPSVEAAPGNGRPHASLGHADAPLIVWQDAGDEALVHVDSLHVRLLPQALVVGVDLESDQTGRGSVIVRFVLGAADDMAGLIASTDDTPHGNPALAARWGKVLREVVWATIVGTVEEHAKERGLAPQALVAVDGQLRLRTTLDIPLAERLGKKPPPVIPHGGSEEHDNEPRLPPVRPPRRGTPR